MVAVVKIILVLFYAASDNSDQTKFGETKLSWLTQVQGFTSYLLKKFDAKTEENAGYSWKDEY